MNTKKMRPSSELATTILVILLTISLCKFPRIESRKVRISGDQELKMVGNEISIPMRGKRVIHDCQLHDDCKAPGKCPEKCALTYCKDGQCMCQLRSEFTLPCRLPPLS